LFARGFLERVLPMPEPPFVTGADGFVGGLAPFFGDVVSVDEVLVRYRVHGANHSESGTVDVAKLRRLMQIDDAREAAQRAVLAAHGMAVPHGSAINIPGYCKQRLLSLILDPAGHPHQGDTLAGLTCRGITASWRFPHTSWGKKALSSVGFAALALLPRDLIARWLPSLTAAIHRPRLTFPAVAAAVVTDTPPSITAETPAIQGSTEIR
jgi:hypothetical protein